MFFIKLEGIKLTKKQFHALIWHFVSDANKKILFVLSDVKYLFVATTTDKIMAITLYYNIK